MASTKIRLDDQVFLGDPTDNSGSWNDGLFQDSNWKGTNPPGTTRSVTDIIDDINEVLMALAPPRPSILDYNQEEQNIGAQAKLAFGNSHGISGYTNADDPNIGPTTLEDSSLTNIGFQETFNIAIMGEKKDRRLGIINSNTDINIRFNADVAENLPYYGAYAFVPGVGKIKVTINGTDVTWTGNVTEIDLSVTYSVSTTSTSPTGLTFSVGEIEYVKNAAGNPFSTVLDTFTYRRGNIGGTGTGVALTITGGSAAMRNGWNWIRITHTVGASNTHTNYIDWIVDADATQTSQTGNDTLTWTGSESRQVSGVEYHTNGTFSYGTATINNLFRNTYIKTVTFNRMISAGGIDSSNYLEDISNSEVSDPTNEDSTTSISEIVARFKSNKKFISLAPPAGTAVNAAIKLGAKFFRTVSNGGRTTTFDTSGVEITNMCFNNTTQASTDLIDDFDDDGNGRRIKSNESNWDDPNLPTTSWSSSSSLLDGGAGYEDGLQCGNSYLFYPKSNYTSLANGPSNQPNYTSCSGIRYYYRYFTHTTAVSSFILKFTGGSATFVEETESDFSGNDVKVSIKLPGVTAWLDCAKAYSAINGVDTDGDGCFDARAGSSKTIGGNWYLTVGTVTTKNSNDRIYMRITFPNGGTAYIDKIEVQWGAN